MKITPIKQIDEEACGPASIKMIADYFKLGVSFEEIAKISKYKEKEGLYNKDAVATLKKLGLTVQEKSRCSWADLKKQNVEGKVILISWMLEGYIGHLSVVNEVTNDSIEIADPAKGEVITLEKLVFQRLWFDYEPHWYPKKNTDIQLRWMAVVSK